jgi:hypothetical protein
MDRFYLQWNIVNWITVVLMAAVGMMLIGAVSSGIRQYSGKVASVTSGGGA